MLGVTMRVMRHSYAGGAVEERDALARDWARFLARVLPGEPGVLFAQYGRGYSGCCARLGP